MASQTFRCWTKNRGGKIPQIFPILIGVWNHYKTSICFFFSPIFGKHQFFGSRHMKHCMDNLWESCFGSSNWLIKTYQMKLGAWSTLCCQHKDILADTHSISVLDTQSYFCWRYQWKVFGRSSRLCQRTTLPKTNIFAPENRPGPKRKFIFQPSIFRCEPLLVSGRVWLWLYCSFCFDMVVFDFMTSYDPMTLWSAVPSSMEKSMANVLVAGVLGIYGNCDGVGWYLGVSKIGYPKMDGL